MFEALSDKLNVVFQRLGNKGRLTEKDVKESLRMVRMALLEADVNFKVSRDLVSRIRERSMSDEVLKSQSPGREVLKITDEELTAVLGGGIKRLNSGDRRPAVILMVGLNGSGKTTTAVKLARYLKQSAQLPVLIAGDLHRHAAIQQLEVLAKQIEIPVYQSGTSNSTVNVIKEGIKRADKLNAAWAIVDTAGRFQVDDDLMTELEEIKAVISPMETLLVVDAMVGQDAVNHAKEFHERIGLTGLILTKMDGDARGGAALSITSVTGVPIKFIGTGEQVNALDEFHPDRLASRILGMGDMLTLIEKTQGTFDQSRAVAMEKKIRQHTFDLQDFLGQLQQLKKMGPLSQIMEMIPGMAALKGRISVEDIDDRQLIKTEAIVYAMTPGERHTPGIIGGSRRRRIAKGSGTTPRDVNQVLNQFRQMQKQLRKMATDKGRKQMVRMINQGRSRPFGS